MIWPSRLLWLLLLAVPLILHVLIKTRPKQIPFAAWRFLPQTPPTKTHKFQFDQPLLLLLRLAIVGFFVLAATGPTCQNNAPTQPAQLPKFEHPVFIVDLSASMRIGTKGMRPLDQTAERLDQFWQTQRFAKGIVYGCESIHLQTIYEAKTLLPSRFYPLLEQAATLGTTDLASCLGQINSTTQDIIVFTDQPAPTLPQETITYRSMYWYQLGQQSPEATYNVGFSEVTTTIDQTTLRIEGDIQGDTTPQTVELLWQDPVRPTTTVLTNNGHFQFELLSPQADARALIRLPKVDMAAWDNLLPIWIAQKQTQILHLLGHFSPDEEHLLSDLFYALQQHIFWDEQQITKTDPQAMVYVVGKDLSAEESKPVLTHVEMGATLIAFAVASETKSTTDDWSAGWVHPAQALDQQAMKPTNHFYDYFPTIEQLDWSSTQIQRLYPLADPRSDLKVLIETQTGLPVLTVHQQGKGLVFTWLIEPHSVFSNLPKSSLWVPIWLALLQQLVTQDSTPVILPAGRSTLAAFDHLQTIETIYQDHSIASWLGWAIATLPNRQTQLVSTRVPPSEITTSTAHAEVVLKATPTTTTTPAISNVASFTLPLVLVGFFWLLQAMLSSYKSRANLLLLPFLCCIAWPISLHAQENQQATMHLWIANESAPTQAQLQGITWLTENWQQRTSPTINSIERFNWLTQLPKDPFVWWAGCRRFEPDTDPKLAQQLLLLIKQHGTLWIDICGGKVALEAAAKRILAWAKTVGLANQWRVLPQDHVLFRSFYLLDGWTDGAQQSSVYGLTFAGHERVFLFSDLTQQLARNTQGGWQTFIASDLREKLIRQSVNLWLYAVTYDYKNDTIHLPYILQRRQRHR